MKLRNSASILGSSIAASAVANGVLADPVNTWDSGYGHMGWGGGYGMFGGFMMLVFWGVVIALIVVAVRWYGPQSLRQGSASSALDILEARFAKGEIDEDEFQKRRAALES